MSSELEARLGAIEGIVFGARHVGLSDKLEDGSAWAHDDWRISISYNGKTVESSYRSGIGHRKPVAGTHRDRGGWYDPVRAKFYRTDLDAAQAGSLTLTTPTLADVLCCLLSDASGADQSFEDWASDLGYDTDSRRALASYLQCQWTRDRLVAMFGRELFAELAQAEH